MKNAPPYSRQIQQRRRTVLFMLSRARPDEPVVRIGSWAALRAQAQPIRFQVFVQEQQVPPKLELDEFDAVSAHALALDPAGKPVGTGRLLPDGHIGRVAVLPPWRNAGIGARIMRALLNEARRQGLSTVELSAQCHARRFYENLGFTAVGSVYMEAGIEHIAMRMDVSAAT